MHVFQEGDIVVAIKTPVQPTVGAMGLPGDIIDNKNSFSVDTVRFVGDQQYISFLEAMGEFRASDFKPVLRKVIKGG